MDVLMVSSEVLPFAKAGGLGDVVPALSKELSRCGHRVRIIMPRYYSIPKHELESIDEPLGVPLGNQEYWLGLYKSFLPDTQVECYFIDHEDLYGRDGVYGTPKEPAFHDNLVRFALLSKASLQLCRRLDWYPDIVHCHDWPTGPALAYLGHEKRSIDSPFAQTAGVMTIHNIGYQGVFPKDQWPLMGLEWKDFHFMSFEFHDKINFLKAGLANAQTITAVSPGYGREIHSGHFGFGLEGLIHERTGDLFGILNGMDYDIWDPSKDPFIDYHYDVDSMGGKALVKNQIQQETGLEVDGSIPVIGVISRLVSQKGFGELVGPNHGSLYRICSELNVQVIILGTGERWCEDELRSLSQALPNLKIYLKYNEKMSHIIEAGSDFFLMPSLYEPCGLTQMYALRYGTIPIVSPLGGLADTVVDHRPGSSNATGFHMELPVSPDSIYDSVARAVRLWEHQRGEIEAMQKRAMAKRFDWKSAAKEYLASYEHGLKKAGVDPSGSEVV